MCATAFAAGDTPEARRSLRHLPGIQVVVEPLDAEAERDGLSRVRLQADVKHWLRMAGIHVLTTAEQIKQPGCPALHVQVMTTKDVQKGLYAVALTVELQQNMLLAHDSSIRMMAATWRAEGMGFVVAKRLCAIRADIQVYVDDFIEDYLTMNPQSPIEYAPSVPRNGHARKTRSNHAQDQLGYGDAEVASRSSLRVRIQRGIANARSEGLLCVIVSCTDEPAHIAEDKVQAHMEGISASMLQSRYHILLSCWYIKQG
jgi:hypothetical protein